MSSAPSTARPKLDRAIIVRAALELLNEVGLDGLSTRRLAERLQVRSPTLYWHVRNKQELLDLMANTILFRAPPDFHMQGDWWVWMGQLARVIRGNLLEYRDGARVVAGTRPTPTLGRSSAPGTRGCRRPAPCRAAFRRDRTGPSGRRRWRGCGWC